MNFFNVLAKSQVSLFLILLSVLFTGFNFLSDPWGRYAGNPLSKYVLLRVKTEDTKTKF